MNTLLKSFGNDLKTIVPLMRDNSEYDTVEKGWIIFYRFEWSNFRHVSKIYWHTVWTGFD